MAASANPLPRPARRVSPEALYVTFLPTLWQAFAAKRELPWPALGVELQVVVVHEAGHSETFAMRFDGGTISGRVGPARAPLATIRCTEEAWRVSVQSILSRVIAYTEAHAVRAWDGVAAFVRGRAASALGAIAAAHPGVLTVHYTDDAGDAFMYDVTLGTGAGPHATVRVQESDLEAILEAGSNVPRLLRSRLKVEGDAAYVLRVATALGAHG